MPGYKYFYAIGYDEEEHLRGVLALPGVHNDSFFGPSTHDMWCVFLHFDEAWTAGKVGQMLGHWYSVYEVDEDSAHDVGVGLQKHIEDVLKNAEGAQAGDGAAAMPADDGAARIFSEWYDVMMYEVAEEVLV